MANLPTLPVAVARTSWYATTALAGCWTCSAAASDSLSAVPVVSVASGWVSARIWKIRSPLLTLSPGLTKAQFTTPSTGALRVCASSSLMLPATERVFSTVDFSTVTVSAGTSPVGCSWSSLAELLPVKAMLTRLTAITAPISSQAIGRTKRRKTRRWLMGNFFQFCSE